LLANTFATLGDSENEQTLATFSTSATPRLIMYFHENERVALFIDGANLYLTTKALGIELDFKRLLSFFRDRSRLIRASYYTAVDEHAEFSALRPLLDWLDYNGFSLVTKPTKEFVDSVGFRKIKGNMSIELAVDALRIAPTVDHIVIFSGDGDFRSLVAALQDLGRRVSVVSTLKTHPPMIADDLRRQADCFVDVVDIEHHLIRAPNGKAPSAFKLQRQL
jgi:uncharacterized LabA/DUF88 family protein